MQSPYGHPSSTVQQFRRAFERFLESIVVALMAALTILVVVGVGFRKGGSALVWYDEVASILLAWLTYYGAAYVALKRGHIGLPTVVERMPSRIRRISAITSEIIVIGFFVVAAWAGWRVLQILGGTYLVSLPWMPTLITQSVIPIGAVLFIIAEVMSFGQQGEVST